MPLNATWHGRHPMPKKPTPEQRLQWHIEHQQHCGCRTMPARFLAALKRDLPGREPPRADRRKRRG